MKLLGAIGRNVFLMNHRRPRLAYPFTVLPQADTVRLVAGEDFRYTLTGPALETWLPDLLVRCTGKLTLDSLLASFDLQRRAQAQQIIERLYGERVLVDGPAAAAHVVRQYGRQVTGQGVLYERLCRELMPDEGRPSVNVLCQDRLDYAAALAAARKARLALEPFLWVSYGAQQRAYISPLFLADAGPCLGCLLRGFHRLSPAPEVYDALLRHGRDGLAFAAADFPVESLDILDALARWKLAQAEVKEPPAALFRLHVLERATMEVTTHRVFVDPDCPECRGGRP